MNVNKKENKAISLTVTDDLTVTVLPDVNHEFLMATREVANGYGVSVYAIRQTKLRNNSELIEGKHFISSVTIRHAASPGSSKGVLWTKRGIVRLGFFIKSERAKLFRDWAEELIVRVDEQRDLFGGVVAVPAQKQLKERRLINRLDRDRLIRLLAMVSRVENNELRLAITDELTGGLQYGAV